VGSAVPDAQRHTCRLQALRNRHAQYAQSDETSAHRVTPHSCPGRYQRSPALSMPHEYTTKCGPGMRYRRTSAEKRAKHAMTGTELLLSSSAALLIGILIGSVGVGGVLMVPWLTQAIGLPVREAVAIAMLSFIATGIAALVISARSLRDPATMRW